MNVIRVFPRRTSMTPTDAMAFVGDPPLWRPQADEVHISCTFTWDIEESKRLQEAWAQYYPIVKLGGPAILDGDYYAGKLSRHFEPGMYVKHGVTFTSRGCPYKCPWCLVPEYENGIRTLPVQPGWIVQDNNLLATPRAHQDQVYAMLRAQGRKVSFPGGLDTRLIDDWVVEQLRILSIKEVFLACDSKGALPMLREAVKKLSFLKRRQLRCYVLIGFRGEPFQEAIERLETVWKAGCLPFAQLYQPPDCYIEYPHRWKTLARTWSRPAAMFALHKESDI